MKLHFIFEFAGQNQGQQEGYTLNVIDRNYTTTITLVH